MSSRPVHLLVCDALDCAVQVVVPVRPLPEGWRAHSCTFEEAVLYFGSSDGLPVYHTCPACTEVGKTPTQL